MKALSTAATGMAAQQAAVDVIANNISNANTTGFKAGRAVFQDLIYQTAKREGAATQDGGIARPIGVNIGLGVQAAGVARLNTQGNLQNTGNDFDVAIEGAGYFVVNQPDGSQAYTRAGNFTLSAEGELVTLDGYLVEPNIVVPENTTDVSISLDGVVSAFVGNQAEPQELGQLSLATFINDAGLKPIGNNLLVQTVASGEATIAEAGAEGFGLIRHKYVEGSNVDPVKEMTQLISAQRTYEMASKVMSTADQMYQTTNQIR